MFKYDTIVDILKGFFDEDESLYVNKCKKTLLIIFLIFTFGCSSNEFHSVSVESDLIQSSLDQISESCEAPRSKYILNTEIVSLQIESENNVTFGFDAFGWINFFQTAFITRKGDFRLEMNITDSLDALKLLAFGSGQSVMQQREFKFSFGIGQFGINYEQFSQTPLAELTRRGLGNSLSDLKIDFDNNAESWNSVVQAVIKENDHHDVIISSGRSSNLKVGDRLSFYNIEHIWSGEPCKSDYIFSRRLSEEPAAIGEVFLIRNHAAQVRVRPLNINQLIKVGDEVKAYALTDEARDLKQSLTIRSIENTILNFENGTFDLTPYLQKQIKGLSSEAGFVIYQEQD